MGISTILVARLLTEDHVRRLRGFWSRPRCCGNGSYCVSKACELLKRLLVSLEGNLGVEKSSSLSSRHSDRRGGYWAV